jgi:hypothetical protein
MRLFFLNSTKNINAVTIVTINNDMINCSNFPINGINSRNKKTYKTPNEIPNDKKNFLLSPLDLINFHKMKQCRMSRGNVIKIFLLFS